jgi:hypothetical protein
MRFLLALIFLIAVQPAFAQTTWPLMRVTYEQYGAVGDCVTDDTVAMMAARDALRAYQDLHAPPDVTPTMITFKPNTCYAYSDNRATWWGLKDLTVEGNGGFLQLMYPKFQANLLLAGATIVNGNTYKINQRGTIDFTTIGAANNNLGTSFVSTGTTVPAGIGNLVGVTNPNEGQNCTYGITGPICPYTYSGVGPSPSSVSLGTYYRLGRAVIETEPASSADRTTGNNGFGVLAPGPLLQTANAGSTSVTCITAGQCNSTTFPQYQWVIIMSYLMQAYQTYPVNMRYVDYAKVVSANGNTVTLDRQLVYTHLSTNPMEPSNSGTLSAGYGPAMIQPAGDPPGTKAPGIEFANSVTLNNLTFKTNPYKGSSGDCCTMQASGAVFDGTTAYASDWPSDRLFYQANDYVMPAGAFQYTLNNVKINNVVPSAVANVTYNNSNVTSSSEVDKLINSVTFNNTASHAFLGGCSSTMSVTYNGGVHTTSSQTNAPVGCTARTVTISNVVINSPHLTQANYLDGWSLSYGGASFPSSGSASNSIFLGGDGSSVPIGGPLTGFTITLDGVKNIATSTTQINITNYNPSVNSGASTFLGCIYPGTVVTDTHLGTPTTATVTSVVQDPLNATGAIVTLGSAVVNSGDTVNCKPYAPGSVTATNNTYINYAGAPILP